MKELKTAVIYPKYLNANGDYGNILMLKQRAELNKVNFSVDNIELGDKINSQKYDFFYIGGTQDEFNPIVTKEFLKHREEFFKIKDSLKTLLGVCFGYQILGKNYILSDNINEIECLGLMDFFTVQKDKRQTGNVTSRMTFMTPCYLVGFENHSGVTYLNEETAPLSYVDRGFGNNGSDKTEGARDKNIIGTYLTGPFLPRNVFFADYLLKITMETKYQEEFDIVDEENTLEEDVHIDFINAKY